MIDVKDCPFCGSERISDGEALTEKPDGTRVTQSQCLECGASGPEAITDGPDYGDVRAIEAWNRRATHHQPVTPAGDVPFATVREVVKALTRLGTSTPEGQEEQAARAVELVGWLCREVHNHFDELSKVTPAGGEVDLVPDPMKIYPKAPEPFDPSFMWDGVDRVLSHAFACGANGDPLDLIQARREIHAATHPPVADAALVLDAGRYRFLKSRAKQSTAYDVYGDGGNWLIGVFSDDNTRTLDDAIDAALNQRGGG